MVIGAVSVQKVAFARLGIPENAEARISFCKVFEQKAQSG
ncbi:hypothetical protein DFO77_101162 [Marinilabilia salmonicolor]|jgi:hypothetical protein|uniref:Uncharacterized protein n=1 Tax=Marinilabilia salmonicolor TaxID=989 RepID=A0A2T0XQR8_9BACT|nr:hypothetical protein BY457_10325 [Marinilabilia salmonicolor]RCW39392.1 hypothetical protein DFO77_101162 [Marinilabilia salmonicolor]